MKRKVLGGILCAVMLLGIGTPAYAEETPPVVEVAVDGELVEGGGSPLWWTSYFPLDETVKLFYPRAEIQSEGGDLHRFGRVFYHDSAGWRSLSGRKWTYLYSAEGLKRAGHDGMGSWYRPGFSEKLWALESIGPAEWSSPQGESLFPRRMFPIQRMNWI